MKRHRDDKVRPLAIINDNRGVRSGWDSIEESTSSVSRKTSIKIKIITLVVTTVVLTADLSMPLGVAGGVPYVATVLMGIWFSKLRHVYLLALLGSVLTIAGYFMSPAGGILWVVLINRGLALFAIWVTALLVVASRKTAMRTLEKSEQRFRDVARAGSDWFWETDQQHKIIWESGHANFIVDLDLNNVGGKARWEIPGPVCCDEEFWKPHRAILESRQEFRDFEYPFYALDGRISYVRVGGVPTFDDSVFTGYRGTTSNITDRKLAEEGFRKLSRAVDFSSSAVIITDIDQIIEYLNPRFVEITGYTREEAIGETPRFLLSEEVSSLVYDNLEETIAVEGEWKGELYNRKKDGSYYWARNSISGVKNEGGEITHYISILDDVTAELELKDQLSYQTRHDNLTGLVNRQEFERRANRLLYTIKQGNSEHALCFLDLDQFKIINDTCGHVAGDELLRQLGHLLPTAVRQHDTLARLGGDEFGVLMERCTLEQAHRVAITLQRAIQEFEFLWEGQSFRVGVSIGLVAIDETTHNLTELLRQADAACFMAKDLGRNRIHTYHPEDSELAQRHGEMQWVARINQALEENRFSLYAQPIIPLGESTEKHYELLLRMVDKNGKILLPDSFLPAAERYGLIGQIDTWVIENALRLLAAHPAFLKQVSFVSINLSGSSLTNRNFLDSIVSQLKTTEIEPGKICFEITETEAISNMSAAVTFITALKKLGCRFALDDFGSGLSSFGYLKNLPVDYLKIDGMFVKGIVDDPIDFAMVKSINDIGQVMGMQTIAEYVESDEIQRMLKEAGINFAQGNIIGKPEPLQGLLY